MPKLKKGFWLLAIALAVLAGLLAPPVAAAGTTLVVQVDEAFEVGGQVYGPAELTVRPVREFGPLAVLSEIRVDGRSLGVVLAREDAGAELAKRDEVIFERTKEGRLVLASVAVQGEPVRRLYGLHVSDHPSWQAFSDGRPTLMASAK